ncbi:tetratricopeptide (TPR) repeat protein [Dysgonomonadaceae bacterium PH5-43]|nr:tetratricopeptide (TPR) repeat protein [Dysgonomonadaceae bacterium PH5-43]
MAKKVKASAPSKAEQNVGEILSKTDQFVDKYWKQMIIGVVAIILIVVGAIVFHNAYLVPREQKAQVALFPCERYFADQEWETALNGNDTDCIGFNEVMSEYSGTASANLAKAYAGICLYNTGDYEAALKMLKKYSGKDKLFAAQVQAMIGDCEVSLGNTKKGVDYFKKAAKKANSSTLSPIYLNKAAKAYESLEDYKSALDLFTTIKTKYPQSKEANVVDKYITRNKALLNK